MNKRSALLLLILLYTYTCSVAQSFRFLPDAFSQRATGQDIITAGSAWPYTMNQVKDDKYDELAGGASVTYSFKSIQDIVRVGVNYDVANVVAAYQYKVQLNIYCYPVSGSPVLLSKELNLNYDPAVRMPFNDLSVYKFSGYHSIKAEITGVQVKTGSTYTALARTAIAKNFFIESEVIAQRYDNQAVALNPSSFATTDGYLDVSAYLSTSPGGVYVGLNYKPVAYELEWTYVDDYQFNLVSKTSSYLFPGSTTLNYDFRKNSTRVQLDLPAYRIPLIYEHGAIVYRFRIVRPDAAKYTDLVYQAWNLPDNGTLNPGASDFNQKGYIIGTAHSSDSLNWQYTINFAEQGKYKHVINYFDGSLKDRQTQTKINSDPDNIVAVEKVYDYEGRPSIVSLPTPVVQGSLYYLKNILTSNKTGKAYLAGDFDVLPGCSMPDSISRLSTTAAAHKYYSPDNPNKTGMQGFVPDAKGFPLVQTVYSPDNTNKVSWQGGAGLEQQLWRGHGTRYEYVRGLQLELDMLLGTEAGYYRFYPKQIVTDPNGQSSFSVLNPAGKVVISALQGAAPDPATTPVDQLANFVAGEEACNELMKGEEQEQLPNGLSTFTTVYNDGAGANSLKYTVKTFPYNTGCAGKYLWVPGYYKVQFTDDCGTPYAALSTSGAVTPTAVSHATVGSSPGYTYAETATLSASMPKGKFFIEKQLTFSEYDIRNIVRGFIKDNEPACYYPEDYFIRKSIEDTKFPCEHEDGTTADTDDLPCEEMRKQMIKDMYPGAKYGGYVGDEDGRFVSDKDNSIFSLIEQKASKPSGATDVYQNGITNRCEVACTATPSFCSDGRPSCGCGDGAHTYPERCCKECLVNRCACIVFPSYNVTVTTPTTVVKSVSCTQTATTGLLYGWKTPATGGYFFGKGDAVITIWEIDHNPKKYYWVISAEVIGCSCGFSDTVWRKFWLRRSAEFGISEVKIGEDNVVKVDILSTAPYISDGTLGSHTCSLSVSSLASTVMTVNAVDIFYRYQADCVRSRYPAGKKHGGKDYTDIASLDPQTFMDIFDDELAEALLPLHPEYCKLLDCESTTGNFEQRFDALQTFQAAEAAGMFTLSQIVGSASVPGKDPLPGFLEGLSPDGYYEKLQYRYRKPFTTTDNWKIDKLALAMVYCGAGNDEEMRICAATKYATQINGMIFDNDDIKQQYFEKLKALYQGSRAMWKQALLDQYYGVSMSSACGPCADLRMKLVRPAVFNETRSYETDPSGSPFTDDYSDLASLDPDRAAMYRSAIEGTMSSPPSGLGTEYNTTRQQLAVAQSEAVANALSQCGLNTTQMTALRAAVESHIMSGQRLTPDALKTMYETVVGVSPGLGWNDLCHPFLISYDLVPDDKKARERVARYSCGDPAVYSGIVSFLNRPEIRTLINNAPAPGGGPAVNGSFTTSRGGFSIGNLFETKLMDALGYPNPFTATMMTVNVSAILTRVPVSPTCTSSCRLYLDLTIMNPSGGSTKMYVQADGMTTIKDYYLGASPAVTLAQQQGYCINTETRADNSGLITQKTAVLKMQCSTCVAPQLFYVWTDAVDLMTPAPSVTSMSDAINCVDIKNTIDAFNNGTDKTTYGFSDAATAFNHPYYERVLCNYLNYKFNKQFFYQDYLALMKGCAVTDQMAVPRHTATVRVEVTPAEATNFVTRMNSFGVLQPSIFQYRMGTVAIPTGNVVFFVDLNAVDPVAVRDYIRYIGGTVFAGKTALAGIVSYTANYNTATKDHILFTLPTCSLTLPGGVTSAIADAAVMENGSYRNYKMRTFRLTSGSATAKDKADLVAAVDLLLHGSGVSDDCNTGYAFWSNELLRSNDYSSTLKQNYLTYIYGLSAGALSAGIDPAALPSGLGWSGYTFSYDDPYLVGSRTHLYAYVPAPGTLPAGYALVKNTILNAVTTAYSNKLFPNEDFSYIPSSSTTLALIRKANGDYWYRYFDANHKLYNVYITPPSRGYGRKAEDYTMSSIAVGPHPNTFVVTLSAPAVAATGGMPALPALSGVKCNGYADFVLSPAVIASNVILDKSPKGVVPFDSLDCERDVLNEAVLNGKAAYYQYFEANVAFMSKDWMKHLVSTSQETLLYCGRKQQYQQTLYYYDLAGNLTRTVPPEGVQPLGMIAMDDVDHYREDPDDYFSDPGHTNPKLTEHKKSSVYRYNSLNQLVYQKTPDGGTTYFFYDAAGRQIFSQNSKQRQKGLYTYSLYDEQGRPVESGEVELGCKYPESSTVDFDLTPCNIYYKRRDNSTASYFGAHPDFVQYSYDDAAYPYADLVFFVRNKYRRQIVLTNYDEMTTDLGAISTEMLSTQENLRSRVAAIRYYPSLSPDWAYTSSPRPDALFATYYSYDLGGNVQTITYDYRDIEAAFEQRFKRVDYDYDLVSGKVNMISYNRGFPDQFYQRYDYDADNRITQVNTSNDGLIWNKDANYTYYAHGPMATLKLGNHKIQSLEYAYTIQGWLKTINSDVLNPLKDMGGNGKSADVLYPRDVISHALRYYDADYKPIGSTAATFVADATDKNLYNGNITQQTTGIAGLGTLQRVYRYDQLQRLKLSTNTTIDNTTAAAVATPSNLYKSSYSYDKDGNISSLQRWDGTAGTPVQIDDFAYKYTGTAGAAVDDNRLMQVTDAVTTTTGGNDLQHGQPVDNYAYDRTGNLVRDKQGQKKIEWDRFGKVSTITDTVSNRLISFAYDGKGNRIWKSVVTPFSSAPGDKRSTREGEYYVRDAGGNILAVYRTHSVYDRYTSLSGLVGIYRGTPSVTGTPGGTVLTDVLATLSGTIYPVSLMSTMHTGHSGWVSAYTDKPVSFYLSADPTLKSNLLYSGEAWIDALRAADPAQHRTAMLHASPDVQNLFMSALNFPTEGKKLLEHYSMDMPAPDCQAIWGMMGSQYIPGSHVTNANNLYTQLSMNGGMKPVVTSAMVGRIDNNYMSALPHAAAFYDGMIADNTLWQSVPLRAQNGPWTVGIRAVVNTGGDPGPLGAFFDGWAGGAAALSACTTPEYKLTTVYESDPVTSVREMSLEASATEVSTILTDDLGDISVAEFGTKFITAGADPATVTTNVYYASSGDTIGLAEHHIYGSSRLGVQRYDSVLLVNALRPAEGAEIRVLKQQRPWYSYSYADLIKGDKKQPYDGTVNTHTAEWYTSRTLGRRYYELTDHLGNVLATVLDRKTGTGTRTEAGTGATLYDYWSADIASAADYYPGGMMMPGRNVEYSWSRMGYNGQAKDDEVYGKGNLNSALFWEMDTRILRRWNVDPVVNSSISSYAIFEGNPIWKNDVFGDSPSTEVTDNNDGTFKVVGGKADGDRNVYVVEPNKSGGYDRTGKVVGKSLTDYSFIFDDNTPMTGAVINTLDVSGKSFLNNEIIGPDISLWRYVNNAKGGEPLDFKVKGIENRPAGMSENQYKYRGMVFEDIIGFGNQDGATLTIASARDIGNVAAGFVAGATGMTWKDARFGFDALESIQFGSITQEKAPTQAAQRIGFNIGSKRYPFFNSVRNGGFLSDKLKLNMGKLLKIVFIIALVFAILFLWYQQSRSFYCLSDTKKCITVWKRLGGKCYVIPGKYFGVTRPTKNFIETSNDNDLTIYWNKNSPQKIIVRSELKFSIVNNFQDSFVIEDFSLQKNENLTKILYHEHSKFSEVNEGIDYISIHIKESYATNKEGKKL